MSDGNETLFEFMEPLASAQRLDRVPVDQAALGAGIGEFSESLLANHNN